MSPYFVGGTQSRTISAEGTIQDNWAGRSVKYILCNNRGALKQGLDTWYIIHTCVSFGKADSKIYPSTLISRQGSTGNAAKPGLGRGRAAVQRSLENRMRQGRSMGISGRRHLCHAGKVGQSLRGAWGAAEYILRSYIVLCTWTAVVRAAVSLLPLTKPPQPRQVDHTTPGQLCTY